MVRRTKRNGLRLDGDEIAEALLGIGVDPSDRGVGEAAFNAIVGAETTPRGLAVIISVGGIAHGIGVDGDPVDAWFALVEMVSTGVRGAEIRRWRRCGVNDVTHAELRESLTPEVVGECATVDPYIPMVLASHLSGFRELRVPVSHVSSWAIAGLLAPERDPRENIAEIKRWLRALGDRAHRYAAAGLTLQEAITMNSAGDYYPQALGVLQSLRSS